MTESSHDETDLFFKILLIGEAKIGKSKLVQQYVCQEFTNLYEPTVGVDFKMKRHIPFGGKLITLQIFDTSGEIASYSIIKPTYKHADAIMLCCDLTNISSFKYLFRHIIAIRENAKNGIPIILVATKLDKVRERQVSTDAFIRKAKSLGCDYVLTSATNNVSVEKAFNVVIQKCLENTANDRLINTNKDYLSQTTNSSLSPRDRLLLVALNQYIFKIEKNLKNHLPDFEYGFLIFKQSRGHNRYANYLLALNLIRELEKGEIPTSQLFSEEKVVSLRAQGHPTRPINSDDLNHIIECGRNPHKEIKLKKWPKLKR